MLSKVEKKILKACLNTTSDDIGLFKLYNNIENKPNFNEYCSAVHSLNDKGYFDYYDEGTKEIYVRLSTKGFNFKTDEITTAIKYLFEYAILPILIGAVSSVITSLIL